MKNGAAVASQELPELLRHVPATTAAYQAAGPSRRGAKPINQAVQPVARSAQKRKR